MRGFDAGFPGILVPKGKTLTITGNGKQDVSSNGYAPGIGGDDDNGGNIVIQGGTIRATGGDGAAAIGSIRFRSCGDITISGGTVTAIGGDDGAGIGSGLEGSCGNITISGGTVIAESVLSASGIGCGHLATCGNISISGGDVTSRGGDDIVQMPQVSRLNDASLKPAFFRISTMRSPCGKASMVLVR